MPDATEIHRRFLSGELAYPEGVESAVRRSIRDASAHENRDEITDAVQAAYAVVGTHEDWLAQAASGEYGGDA